MILIKWFIHKSCRHFYAIILFILCKCRIKDLAMALAFSKKKIWYTWVKKSIFNQIFMNLSRKLSNFLILFWSFLTDCIYLHEWKVVFLSLQTSLEKALRESKNNKKETPKIKSENEDTVSQKKNGRKKVMPAKRNDFAEINKHLMELIK